MKYCERCGKETVRYPDGRCVACLKAQYTKHREKILKRVKAYQNSHQTQISARRKAHYAAHREEKQMIDKAYYEKHREAKKKWQRTYYLKHQEERNAYLRSYRARNRERLADKNKNSHLLSLYRISLEQYNAKLHEQNGACFLCERPEISKQCGKLRSLTVDHCHTTNKIRRLLCTKCNSLLGMANDDPSLLRRAATYLEEEAKKE
jgi:hypothetical protein